MDLLQCWSLCFTNPSCNAEILVYKRHMRWFGMVYREIDYYIIVKFWYVNFHTGAKLKLYVYRNLVYWKFERYQYILFFFIYAYINIYNETLKFLNVLLPFWKSRYILKITPSIPYYKLHFLNRNKITFAFLIAYHYFSNTNPF